MAKMMRVKTKTPSRPEIMKNVYFDVNLFTDHVNVTDGYFYWSLADIWYDLDFDDISTPNLVVETLRLDQPKTTKEFYLAYRNRDFLRNDTEIKDLFKAHGYKNATNWPPGGTDPDRHSCDLVIHHLLAI